jgi:hypothetical protein
LLGEKDVKSIHIFGDSLNVINWARKTQRCHNIFLLPLLEEVLRILDTFDSFYVWHVYRECNLDVDSLSKEGIQMGYGKWVIFAWIKNPFISKSYLRVLPHFKPTHMLKKSIEVLDWKKR